MVKKVFLCVLVVLTTCVLVACNSNVLTSILQDADHFSKDIEVADLFYNSLYDGNCEAVKEAVTLGANVDTLKRGQFPAENALYYYSIEHMGIDAFGRRTGVEIAEYLLEVGADPNRSLNQDGVSLLMYTCGALPTVGAGADVLFELLLKHDADVNVTDKSGYTALDYAVSHVERNKAEKLLERGAVISGKTLEILVHPNATDLDLYERASTAQVILNTYATAQESNMDQYDIQLCIAAAKGDSKLVLSMLEQPRDECTALEKILVVAFCNQSAVEKILPLDQALGSDYFALAVAAGNTEVAIYLQNKYDVSDVEGLRISVENGHEALSTYYLKSAACKQLVATANEGNEDADAYQVLHDLLCNASESGHMPIVSSIVENGPQYTAFSIYTATWEAINNDCISVVEYLCEVKNFDINFTPEGLDSLLGNAVTHGNKDIVEMLIRCGAQYREDEDYLHSAALKGNVEVLNILLKSSDFLGTGALGKGGSALVAAIQSGNREIVKLLIDAGVDPNEKLSFTRKTSSGTEEGYSYPVHQASRAWSSGILKQLIDAGADTNLRDSDGNYPIDLAINEYNKVVLS